MAAGEHATGDMWVFPDPKTTTRDMAEKTAVISGPIAKAMVIAGILLLFIRTPRS